MKNTLLTIVFSFFGAIALFGQSEKSVKFTFKDAQELTMLGQLFPENPNPFQRVDTLRFKGFNASESRQVRSSTGLICAFRTNSTIISVKPEYGEALFPTNTLNAFPILLGPVPAASRRIDDKKMGHFFFLLFSVNI